MNAARPRPLAASLRRLARGGVQGLAALIAVGPVTLACVLARCRTRRAVGLGPEPLINNVHHAKALRRQGYEAVTFVSHVYFVTQAFDVRDLGPRPLNHSRLFLRAIFRCRILYIYFNGGPLAWTGLRRLEPWLYRLAGVKVVAMPYGGDVQDFAVHDDVVYRSAYLTDYPQFIREQMRTRKAQVRRWSRHADWIISGCDWVRYMPHWDTLMLAHFSVDTEQWRLPTAAEYDAPARFSADRPLRVLHAPNHRAIKGTALLEKAVARLQAEGVPVELKVVQRLSNDEVRALVRQVDVVAEQFVIGWYGIFALEAMASGKPVLTYIAPELERLYLLHGLLERNELPVLRADHLTLEQQLRDLAGNRVPLAPLRERARAFVEKHHSLAAVGARFTAINTALGLPPAPPATETSA